MIVYYCKCTYRRTDMMTLSVNIPERIEEMIEQSMTDWQSYLLEAVERRIYEETEDAYYKAAIVEWEATQDVFLDVEEVLKIFHDSDHPRHKNAQNWMTGCCSVPSIPGAEAAR
jgi:C4-type Zn-finger protein